MDETIQYDRRQRKAARTALLAGFLMYLGMVVLQYGHSYVVFILSLGACAPFVDNLTISYSLAVLFFGLSCWRSVTLYRQRVMSLWSPWLYLAAALLLSWMCFEFLASQTQIELSS